MAGPMGETRRPASGRSGERAASRPGATLRVIPVDPHRVFVRWQVSEQALGGAPAEARLILRLARPEAAGGTVEEFVVEGGWHEGFFSVRHPGGAVEAGLGWIGADARFHAVATCGRVTLPEPRVAVPAPVAPPLPPVCEAAPPSVRPVVPPPPVHAAPKKSRGPALPAVARVLDEAAILAAAARSGGLPPELCRLPGQPGAAEARGEAGSTRTGLERVAPAGEPPRTPVLEEGVVVLAALRELAGEAPSGAPLPADRAGVAPVAVSRAATAGVGGSSARLGSHFDAAPDQAPLSLEATVIIAGRVPSGHRLRLGRHEVALRPGGRFSSRHRIENFATAWSLLHQVAAAPPPGGPLLRLLGGSTGEGTSFALHSSVEFRGTVRDPEYRRWLPDGLEPDAAGCFRLSRPLPAGAFLLPQLALVADPGAASA